MSQLTSLAGPAANTTSTANAPTPQAPLALPGPLFGAGAAPVATTDAFDIAASCDPLHTHASMTSFPQAPWATAGISPAAPAPTTVTAGPDQATQAQTTAHQQTLLAAPPAFLTAAAQPYMVNAAGQITPAPSQQQSHVLGASAPGPSPHQQQQFVMTLPQHHPFILQQPAPQAPAPATATAAAAGNLPQQPQQAMIVTGPNGQQMILGPAAAATLMQQAAAAQQPQTAAPLAFPGAPSPIAAAPPTVASPPGRAPDTVPSSVNTAGKRKAEDNALEAQQLSQRLKVEATSTTTALPTPVATTAATAPAADDVGTAISLSSSVATPASSAASSGSVVPTTAPTAAQQTQQQFLVPVIPHVAPQSTVSNPVLVSSDGTMSMAATGSVSSLAQVTAGTQPPPAPLPALDDSDKLCADAKMPDLSHLPPEERRRYERNQREQQRSHKISQQIKELRDVLSQSNIPFKPNKFSILLSVVNYIKQLQARAVLLDAEHRKLINTVRQTTDIVNSGQSPESVAATNGNAAGAASGAVGGAAAPAPGGVASATPTVGNDADLLIVQGLDYKSVFDQCSAAMGVAALDGRFIACNNEFEVISGYSKEEITRQSLFNLVTSKDMEEVFNVMGAMLKGEGGNAAEGSAANLPGTVQAEASKPRTFWSGVVTPKRLNIDLLMNITLTRTSDGMPKFFNCALTAK